MREGRAKSFKSGNSLAVRVPKAFAFPEGQELVVVRDGDVMTLRPAMRTQPEKTSFQRMLEALRALPAPDQVEVREPIEFPERPGL